MSRVTSAACYLYGVRRAGDGAAAFGPGVDSSFPVEARSVGSLEILISAVREEDFSRLEEADVQWTVDRIRDHDRVVRAAAAEEPLIPFRFGSVVSSESAAIEGVRQNRRTFEAAMARIAGKEEWGVRVIEAENRAAPADAASEASRPRSGTEYLMAKRQQLRNRDAERAEWTAWLEDCHACLARRAAEAAVLPSTRTGTGLSEPTVHNGAYLVAREEFESFRACFEELAEDGRRRGLEFRLTGPWPVYSFVDFNMALRADSECAPE